MKGYMKIIGLLLLVALLVVVSQIQRIEESFTTNIIQEGDELHQLNEEILSMSPDDMASKLNI
jgi:hypothetical protein